MSLNYALPSHGSTSEYQCSGVPYVSSSHVITSTGGYVEFNMPFVLRHFTIFNSGSGAIRVGFTLNGIFANPDANYLVVQGNSQTPRLEIKCMKVFVRKDEGTTANVVSIVAGLTNVTQDRFFAITGSNGVAGVG